MNNKSFVFKQKPIRLLGEFKQLYGGASTWITLAIFMFSGISAWNTHTMTLVRETAPWLSLPVFIGIIVAGMTVAMWLEHKFVQPSVMVYWNQMFYNHGNPMRARLESIETKLDTLLKEHEQGTTPTAGQKPAKRRRAA